MLFFIIFLNKYKKTTFIIMIYFREKNEEFIENKKLCQSKLNWNLVCLYIILISLLNFWMNKKDMFLLMSNEYFFPSWINDRQTEITFHPWIYSFFQTNWKEKEKKKKKSMVHLPSFTLLWNSRRRTYTHIHKYFSEKHCGKAQMLIN